MEFKEIKGLPVNFLPRETRENLVSGEDIKVSFGKLQKIIDDLGLDTVTDVDVETHNADPTAHSSLRTALDDLRSAFTPKSFTLAVSAWVSSGRSDFPFSATIANSEIAAADYVDVAFNVDSINIAATAGIVSGETSAGQIKLFAKKAPTATVSGVYTITKGAE